jgi:nitroimidazol reductase NimA-like FMN-containing flavoprotein (pyridoxamine 5'-phosphate oxidase superfamily)
MITNRRKVTFLNKLEQIEPIIVECNVCYVSMVDANNKPYVLPFNFGYKNGIIYLHSAPEGKKINILKNNPNVCINFSTAHNLFSINEEIACSYGMQYKSVLINSKVEFIENDNEKIEAFNIFMKNYVKNRDFKYSSPSIKEVAVFKVKVDNFTGKLYGY